MQFSSEDFVYNRGMKNRLKIALGCFTFVFALFAGVGIYNGSNDTPQKEETIVPIASPALHRLFTMLSGGQPRGHAPPAARAGTWPWSSAAANR